MTELPPGWAESTIGGVTLPISNVDPKTAPDDSFIYVDIGSVDNGTNRIVGPKSLLGREAPSRARQLLKTGDTLFSTVRTYLRKIGFVDGSLDGAVGSTGFAVLRPSGGIHARLLYYFSLTREFVDGLSAQMRGTSYPAVVDSQVRDMPIPVPPAAEQERIVAVIEEQFSRLDAGVAALERVQQNLKRMRAATVELALLGAFTDHVSFREPVQPKLLRKMAQLPKRRHQTVTGASRTLPIDWEWSNLDIVCSIERNALKAGPFGSSLKKESYVEHGYKVYGQEQVIRSDPFYGNYFISEGKYRELVSCAVRPRDLLVSLVGTIGRTLVLPPSAAQGIINPRLIKITMDESLMSPEFMSTFLQSPRVRATLRQAAHGGTMDVVNLGMLRNLAIPCPPLEHQAVILERMADVDNAIAKCDQIIATVQLRQARLRSSILSSAFKGKLAPQDARDEPAFALLDRIVAERRSSNDHGPTRARKPPAKVTE